MIEAAKIVGGAEEAMDGYRLEEFARVFGIAG